MSDLRQMLDPFGPEDNHGVIVRYFLLILAGIALIAWLDMISGPAYGGETTDYTQTALKTAANLQDCGHLPQNETACLEFGLMGFVFGGVFGWLLGTARPNS